MLKTPALQALARPIDIYVGANKYTDRGDPSKTLGYIRAPSMKNPDVSDFNVRMNIAGNAFGYMYNNVFAPMAAGDTRNYNTVQGAFTRMLDPSNLYKPPAVLAPLAKWGI
jgi:hypothetical protein